MRSARMLLPLIVFVFSIPANAETWRARGTLLEKSGGTCAGYPIGVYVFELVGTAFTVSNVNGKQGTTTAAADGAVKYDFKAALGGGTVSISGNAKTKELVMAYPNYGCYWKFVTEK